MRHSINAFGKPVAVAALAVLLVSGCCCPPDPCGPCGRTPCAPLPCCPNPCGPARGYTIAGSKKPLPPPEGITPAGFLTEYGLLKRNPDVVGSYMWMKEGLDLRTYDNLLIDDIEVLLDDETKAKVPEEVRVKAAQRFREILLDTIDPFYAVVDEPGLHVLRVRLALTDLVPAPATEEGVTEVQAGGAELEGELLDSLTGDRLLMVVSRIEGSEQGMDVPEEWKAAEGAFREWAARLLTFLDSFREE